MSISGTIDSSLLAWASERTLMQATNVTVRKRDLTQYKTLMLLDAYAQQLSLYLYSDMLYRDEHTRLQNRWPRQLFLGSLEL